MLRNPGLSTTRKYFFLPHFARIANVALALPTRLLTRATHFPDVGQMTRIKNARSRRPSEK